MRGAIAAYREAIRLKPDYAAAHNNLGAILCDVTHDYAGAEAEFREAIRLKPDDALAHFNLGNALHGSAERAGAIAAYREAIRLKPDYAAAHSNLGNALSSSGDGAGRSPHSARRSASSPTSPRPTATSASPCGGRGNMPSRWPSSAWGTNSARSGPDCAIRRPRGSPRPSDSPPWPTGSRRSWPARPGRPTPPRAWRSPRCSTTRSGTPPPPGSGPRRWRPTRSSVTTAAQHRYIAARAAALAAAGRGKDEPPPDAAAKAELRRKALDWLRAELAAWSKVLDSDDPKAGAAVAPTLRHWKEESDLAGVRDRDAIAASPPDERRAWEASGQTSMRS